MVDLSNISAQLDALAEPESQPEQSLGKTVEHSFRKRADLSSLKEVEHIHDGHPQGSHIVDLSIGQSPNYSDDVNFKKTSMVRRRTRLATVNIGQCRESELQPLVVSGLMRVSSAITLPTKSNKAGVQTFAHQRRRSMSSIDMIKFFQAQQIPSRKRTIHSVMAERLRPNMETTFVGSRTGEDLPRTLPMGVPPANLTDMGSILLSLKRDRVALISLPFKHAHDVPKSVPVSNLPSSYREVLGTSHTGTTKKGFHGRLGRRATIAVQRELVPNPFPHLTISGMQMEMEGELPSIMKKVVEDDTFEVEEGLQKALRKWVTLVVSVQLGRV